MILLYCFRWLFDFVMKFTAREKIDHSAGTKKAMITCVEMMTLSDHICVGSVDCALTVYDRKNLDVST